MICHGTYTIPHCFLPAAVRHPKDIKCIVMWKREKEQTNNTQTSECLAVIFFNLVIYLYAFASNCFLVPLIVFFFLVLFSFPEDKAPFWRCCPHSLKWGSKLILFNSSRELHQCLDGQSLCMCVHMCVLRPVEPLPLHYWVDDDLSWFNCCLCSLFVYTDQ